MRRATNADVANVEVEIDRPEDRASKKNERRSNSGSSSVSGSGGSNTIITNNSEGNWYLQTASVVAAGSSLALGVLQVQVQVRDENGTVISELEVDPAVSNLLVFGGHVVKPGWDVHAVVSQQDANNYTVNVRPSLRKPDPSSLAGSGGGSTETSATVFEDFERSTPLSDYAGDTTEYATTTSAVYHNDTALHYNSSTTNTRHEIVSTTGLSDYPSDPFVMDVQVRSSESYDGSTDITRVGPIFGAADTSNFFTAQLWPKSGDFDIVKYDAGAQNTISTESSGLGSNTYPGSEWWRMRIDVDEGRSDTIVARLYDTNGDLMGERTTGSETMFGTGIGVFGEKTAAGDDHYVDYYREP